MSRTVKRLMQGNWFGSRTLFIGFTDATFGIHPGLTLHVGDDAYDLNDAYTGSSTYDWPIGSRAEWGENETLCVALTLNLAKKGHPTRLRQR